MDAYGERGAHPELGIVSQTANYARARGRLMIKVKQSNLSLDCAEWSFIGDWRKLKIPSCHQRA